MKKYLMGSTAVLLAICFSSFSSFKPKAKATDLYWFQISNKHTPGNVVPMADAAFLQQSTLPPSGSGCSGTQTYDCVAGFNESQVNTSTHQLINNLQIPQSVPALKPN